MAMHLGGHAVQQLVPTGSVLRTLHEEFDKEMQRLKFQRDGLTLSFLDAANGRHPLVALHAHWMEGATFRKLPGDLDPKWRVIALDQRGHGYSDHAAS